MARSTDSFFIRADVELANTDYTTTQIDLGAYVDALGKSVLRIHNIVASLQQGSTGTAVGMAPTMAGDQAGSASWQLTTQNQSSLVLASDRSVISSGSIWCGNRDSAANPPAQAYEGDMLPQEWTNGYLVAVESLQLGAQRTDDWTAGDKPTYSLVLECTVETMTQSAAMALALSQQ